MKKTFLLKNRFLLFFCKLLKPKSTNTFDKNHPKILVVSTTALGDTLWATPAITNIKKQYPNSTLCLLTSKYGKNVIEGNPHIDKIYTWPSLPFLLSLLRKMRKEKFQAILFFHVSQRIVLPFCKLLKASQIIGSCESAKGLETLFTRQIEKKDQHEIERRLEIAKAIHVLPFTKDLHFVIREEERKIAKRFLEAFPKPHIAMHAGAANSFRKWPKSSFILLGNLLNSYKGTIFITGSKKEKEACQAISEKIPNSIPVSYFSLPRLGALLEQIDLFISNDTGPLHISCALNKKNIALYSPTDPKICGPLERKHSTLFYKKPCCVHCCKKKCTHNYCMLQITPYEVFKTCQTLLT